VGVERFFRHPAGGFREAGAQPFQANANMHLFEAALAWEAAGGEGWGEIADEIAGLALAKFIDGPGGFLREFFDAGWRPAAGEDGRLVEPGHQFEWAWLLERWGRLRGRADAQAAARRLFAAGARGVDPGRGVAINALSDDLTVRDAAARLWPQTEHLKAALILGEDAAALTAANGLALYLQTPVQGLWRDRLRPDGGFEPEPAPASSFYHIVCALQALLARA
jgi:mannose-1-phosphate guanylyltransferase/mannose-6-phosphate isomerase